MFENENVRWVKWAGWLLAYSKVSWASWERGCQEGNPWLMIGGRLCLSERLLRSVRSKTRRRRAQHPPTDSLFSLCPSPSSYILRAGYLQDGIIRDLLVFPPHTHGRPSSLMETTPSRRPRNRWCSGNSRGICYYWSGRAAFLVLAESWELSWEKRKVALNRLLFAPLKCRGGGRVVVVERIYFPVWPKCWRVTFVSIRIKRERKSSSSFVPQRSSDLCDVRWKRRGSSTLAAAHSPSSPVRRLWFHQENDVSFSTWPAAALLSCLLSLHTKTRFFRPSLD